MIVLEKMYYLNAGDIPGQVQDACLDIDSEFPLHYSSGIVCFDKKDYEGFYIDDT